MFAGDNSPFTEKVLTYTDKENSAVCHLLEKLEFNYNPDDYMYSDTTNHYEITKTEYDAKWGVDEKLKIK